MPVDNIEFDENLYFEALDLQSMSNGETKPCNLIPPPPRSIRGAVGVAAEAKIGFDGHSQLNVGNHPFPLLFCSNASNREIKPQQSPDVSM